MTAGQFGHATDEDVPYAMNYHVFLASLGFKPSPVFNLHMDFTYTMNEGSFDDIIWSGIDPEAVTRLVNTGKWDYDFTEVNDLSDIKINNYNISVGADVMLLDNVSLYSLLSYAKWEDEEFVTSDDTGDYFIGSLGFMFTF